MNSNARKQLHENYSSFKTNNKFPHNNKKTPPTTPTYASQNRREQTASSKTSVYKNRSWNDDLHEVFGSYRSTIHATAAYSPAQLFFHRSLNDKLSTTK